jgi:hypothetical protein
MASLLPTVKMMFLDNDGSPLVGGKLFTFDSGTNTPRPTFADAAGTVQNPNPVVLDSRGEALVFWNGSYRVRLEDTLGNMIWTVDSVSEIILNYRTGSSGSLIVPAGATSQRDVTPQLGYFRYNTDTNQFEGYGIAGWGNVGGDGGGGTGGGNDIAFFEGDTVITAPFTIGESAYKIGVAITLTNPGIFNLANHGFMAGNAVHLTTTGVLPSGLATDTPYYVSPTGLTSNTFQLALTPDGVSINTTGPQSGVHSIGKIKNAFTPGPVTLTNAAIVTVPTGSNWSIL